MIRKISTRVLFIGLSMFVLTGVLSIAPAQAGMMGEKPMDKGSDTMMADTMMKRSDAMMDETGAMPEKKGMMKDNSMMGDEAMKEKSDSMDGDGGKRRK